MGDEERSFISLKKKEPKEGDDEPQNDDEEKDGNAEQNSVQNNTNEGTGPEQNIVAGSRPDTDNDTTTDRTERAQDVVNGSVADIAVPVSLIVAGNLLVMTVIAWFEPSQLLWLFAMVFASVEVLVGAAIWYFS